MSMKVADKSKTLVKKTSRQWTSIQVLQACDISTSLYSTEWAHLFESRDKLGSSIMQRLENSSKFLLQKIGLHLYSRSLII